MQKTNSKQNHSEKAVRKLLERLDFECCAEPDWIKAGKKPDFFCTCRTRTDIWAEVKSLGMTPDQKKAEDIWKWFDQPCNIDRPGAYLSAYYAPDVKKQDVKHLLKFVIDIIKRNDQDKFDFIFVIIPHDPVYGENIEFSIQKNNRRLLISSVKSRSHRYGAPYLHWKVGIGIDDVVDVLEAGRRRVCSAGELGLNSEDVKLACHVKAWPCHKVSLVEWARIGKASLGWPDANRILDDAKDAAKKIKNALKYKTAPSIIFLVSDNDSHESREFRAHSLKVVFFGMPTLAVSSSGSSCENSSVIHGSGGFWNKQKNTSVSAVCYVSNGEAIFLIHNPFAKYPCPEGLLGCEEYRLSEDRKAQRVR